MNIQKLINRLKYIEGRIEWLDELIPYKEKDLKESADRFENTEKTTRFDKPEQISEQMISFREAIVDMVNLSILMIEKEIKELKDEKEELLKEKEFVQWDIELINSL